MESQAPVPLNFTLGALEIGFMVSGCLFGALTIQALVYHSKFQQTDGLLIQLLVGTIWFLELGQLCSVFHGIYYLTITNHGHIEAMLHPPRTVGISFLLSSCVGPLVESFYVTRLFLFSKKLFPSLIGWSLALTRLAGWLYISAHALSMHSFTQFTNDWGWLLEVLLSASAFIDLAIALANCYYLAKRRGTTRERMVTGWIDRIINWTLQTGLITSLSFIITLLCFLFSRQYLIWMAVSSALTKVFSNCLLASLNARITRDTVDNHPRRNPGNNQTILSFVAGSPGGTVINYMDVHGRRSSINVPARHHSSRANSMGSRREVYWAI